MPGVGHLPGAHLPGAHIKLGGAGDAANAANAFMEHQLHRLEFIAMTLLFSSSYFVLYWLGSAMRGTSPGAEYYSLSLLVLLCHARHSLHVLSHWRIPAFIKGPLVVIWAGSLLFSCMLTRFVYDFNITLDGLATCMEPCCVTAFSTRWHQFEDCAGGSITKTVYGSAAPDQELIDRCAGYSAATGGHHRRRLGGGGAGMTAEEQEADEVAFYACDSLANNIATTFLVKKSRGIDILGGTTEGEDVLKDLGNADRHTARYCAFAISIGAFACDGTYSHGEHDQFNWGLALGRRRLGVKPPAPPDAWRPPKRKCGIGERRRRLSGMVPDSPNATTALGAGHGSGASLHDHAIAACPCTIKFCNNYFYSDIYPVTDEAGRNVKDDIGCGDKASVEDLNKTIAQYMAQSECATGGRSSNMGSTIQKAGHHPGGGGGHRRASVASEEEQELRTLAERTTEERHYFNAAVSCLQNEVTAGCMSDELASRANGGPTAQAMVITTEVIISIVPTLIQVDALLWRIEKEGLKCENGFLFALHGLWGFVLVYCFFVGWYYTAGWSCPAHHKVHALEVFLLYCSNCFVMCMETRIAFGPTIDRFCPAQMKDMTIMSQVKGTIRMSMDATQAATKMTLDAGKAGVTMTTKNPLNSKHRK